MGAQGTGAPPCALAHHVKYVGRGTDHNIQAPALLTVNDPVCASRCTQHLVSEYPSGSAFLCRGRSALGHLMVNNNLLMLALALLC